jgi:hypothetical protein
MADAHVPIFFGLPQAGGQDLRHVSRGRLAARLAGADSNALVGESSLRNLRANQKDKGGASQWSRECGSRMI